MRIATLAIVAVLAMSVAFPAAAAKRLELLTYEDCQRMAEHHGLHAGQHGYLEYVRQCTGAKPGAWISPR
jgi:hypothetical protein